jgi:hypothetical protein
MLSEHTGNDTSSLWFSSLESLSRRSIVFTFLKSIWYQRRILLYVSMRHLWRCVVIVIPSSEIVYFVYDSQSMVPKRKKDLPEAWVLPAAIQML